MVDTVNPMIKAARDVYLKKYHPTRGPVTILLKLTDGCNLRCTYCYYNSEKVHSYLSVETVEKLLDQYFAMHYNHINILFHGGEPLLNSNLLKDIVKMIKSKYYSPRVKYTIQTNGTLIKEEDVPFYKSVFQSIGISIDGFGIYNDATRKMANGSGSFAKVLEGIQMLKKNGISYGILSVISKHNIDHLCEILDWCSKNDIYHFGFELLFPGGRGADEQEFIVKPEEYWKAMQKVIDWIVEYNSKAERKKRIYIRDLESITSKIVNHKQWHMCHQVPCGGGKNHISLDHDGNIYVCDTFGENDEYLMGNINTMPYEKIIQAPIAKKVSERERNQECCQCKNKDYCLCGCPARNIAIYGPDGFWKKNYMCSYYYQLSEYMYDLLINKKVDPILFNRGIYDDVKGRDEIPDEV